MRVRGRRSRASTRRSDAPSRATRDRAGRPPPRRLTNELGDGRPALSHLGKQREISVLYRSSAPRTATASGSSRILRAVRIAFLFDVDNTLLDNDRVKADLAAGIEDAVGKAAGDRFWELYEEVRRMRDYVDYLHTLERFREVFPNEPGFPAVADLVLGYPYKTVLYPGALEVIAKVQSMGPAAIVTDGDPVYQPAKIARAGIADAVERRVFLFIHKEAHLAEVQGSVPADRYVIFDDKIDVLARVERLDDRVFTVHVRQGHYGREAATDNGPRPDRSIDRIGDLLDLDLVAFLADSG